MDNLLEGSWGHISLGIREILYVTKHLHLQNRAESFPKKISKPNFLPIWHLKNVEKVIMKTESVDFWAEGALRDQGFQLNNFTDAKTEPREIKYFT